MLGAISFIPLAFGEYLVHPDWIFTVTPTDIFSVLYYALFGSIGAYILYEYGLSQLSADTTALTQHLTPIVTITLAILFLHEHVGMPFILGSVVLFCGIAYSTISFTKRQTQPVLHEVPESVILNPNETRHSSTI